MAPRVRVDLSRAGHRLGAFVGWGRGIVVFFFDKSFGNSSVLDVRSGLVSAVFVDGGLLRKTDPSACLVGGYGFLTSICSESRLDAGIFRDAPYWICSLRDRGDSVGTRRYHQNGPHGRPGFLLAVGSLLSLGDLRHLLECRVFLVEPPIGALAQTKWTR